MPRADGGESAAAETQTTNPTRRSRFSLPWKRGGADEDMDSGLNDRLLADNGDSQPGEQRKWRPLACGCCTVLVLFFLVYGMLLYHAYSGLSASLPGLLIQPVKVSGFCHEEIVARGRVQMDNQASWTVHVTAKSSEISLPGGPVAFSMQSSDRMGFGGSCMTSQDAVQRVKIKDPAAAGRLIQDFAVLGAVKAHVVVQMVVEISLLPGAYNYLYKADHTFSSQPTGPEASIPGCLNGSTVQQQAIHRLSVLQNDAFAARTEVAVSMAWYKAWSFTAEFPPTEWRLRNKLTREPIAYVAVPAAVLRDKSARAATTLNASIPREFAEAAGDAFRRTMDLSALSIEMVGTGRAGDITGQCQNFAKLLENFVYPVYLWDAATNATYNRDPYAPGVNPCNPSQVQNYVDALLDVTSLDMVRSNGSHAWLKVAVSTNVTDGLGKVGTTAKLALLNSTKVPPMQVSLHRPGGEVVMTTSATFDGCLAHFKHSPYWCKQAYATIMIHNVGTGVAMDQIIADSIASKVSNFTVRISGVDVVKAARASSTISDGNLAHQVQTVLATVAGTYPQLVHVDLVSKGLNGTRARIDNAKINYTDHDGLSIQVSPLYPAPIFVSGQYNDTVQRRLDAQWLQVNAGVISVDVRCDSETIGMGTVHMDSSTNKFPLAVQFNIEDALNSRCLGGTAGALSSDGDGEQPPVRFSVEITPTSNPEGSDAKPFSFNSSYIVANSSDGSMDLNFSKGFHANSICDTPVPFSLTTPAPGFLTFLGDVDITAQAGRLVFEGEVGAAIEHSKDPAGSGPHIKIRGNQMIFDFILYVDDPLIVGSMINIWYSTWIDLAFQLSATEVSIVSASTNPVSFSHSMVSITKGFYFPNGASAVTDVITSLDLKKSTDDDLEAAASVVFNLTESVAQGWGFPPFDITVPVTHFNVVTFGPEGYLNYSLATLTTSPFRGFHGTDYLGPIVLSADTKERDAAAKWVGAYVNMSLGCMHKPWRTLEENMTLSIQLMGDTNPAYQEKCLFQAAMPAVSFPLIRYPYSNNATRESHDVRVARLQLTTHVNEDASEPSVELVLVLGNGTDGSIRNVMADLPSLNLILNGQLEVQDAKSELLTGQLTFDRNRFHGMSSAAIAARTSQVGQLLNTLVETSADNISVVYSFDVQPDTPNQGFLASMLHSAADAASSCMLAPAPAPAPAPMPAQTLVEKFRTSVEAGLQNLLESAYVESSVDPLAGVGIVVEVHTTPTTLAVTARANITAAAAPLTRLLGNESVSLSYGELGLDVYRGAADTVDVIGSAVAGVRLLSLSTEEVAVVVNTSAGAAMDAASQLLADYLTQPRVNAIARLVLRGQSEGDGKDAGAAHERHGANGASGTGLSKSPEVDVDVDVRIPGSGSEFPCDPKPPTPDGTCKPISGFFASFSPVDGICMYVGGGLKGLSLAVTASVPNPLPLPITLQEVQVAVHAEATDSAGTLTKYNTIATGTLPKPVTIPAHSDGTMVLLPCTLDDSVGIATAGKLLLAYESDRLSISIGGPSGSATGTLSVSGGRYEQGTWTPDPSSQPVYLTVQLTTAFKALVSVDECANVGRHFTAAECPTATCDVKNPPADCLVATCSFVGCGGCGYSCLTVPGCAHAKQNGAGSSMTCSCQAGYCVSVSPQKTKTCAKNLGPPLPEVCHGTVTDGSCRYAKSCGSWRGPSGSVQCVSGRCVCSTGYCHDGKGRCTLVPHQVRTDGQSGVVKEDFDAVLRMASGLL